MTALEIVLETRAPTKTFESDGAPVRALRGVHVTMAPRNCPGAGR
jgi:hypothetical protein